MALPVLAILAGGLATRMGSLTERTPKAMLNVAGEPFIAHQLRRLVRHGVTDVVLCVGHMSKQVTDFVGDGSLFGLSVRYSHDGPTLLGTGGALRLALPMLGERFFVLYGDSYLDVDFAAMDDAFVRSGKAAMMTIFRNDGRWDQSNVRKLADGAIIYDKRHPDPAMDHIDYGLTEIGASALAARAEDRAFDVADFYHDLSLRGDLAAHEVFARFYEIGTETGLRELEGHLRHGRRNPRPSA